MDDEQKEFEAALLRSVEHMKVGRFARKTVFAEDGDTLRRVVPESPPRAPGQPDPAS